MAHEIMDKAFYRRIKEILSSARAGVYSAANFAMVNAYWEIGKSIVEKQGGNATAEYGSRLIEELSKQMTADFGKGFTAANLKNMRQFYLTFPNRYALRSQLSWSHYRLIMRVEDEQARNFYVEECASQIGVRVSLKGKSIRFPISVCLPAEATTMLLMIRLKKNRGRLPKTLFAIPMCWSFWDWKNVRTFTSPIWNRLLSIIYKSFCLSSGAVFRLRTDKSTLTSTAGIFILTLYFIIIF